MAKRVEIKVKLPATTISVDSETNKEHLEDLVTRGEYPKVMSFILNKVMSNPNILMPKAQTLMQRQVTEIGKAIVYMGQQQTDIISSLTNSNNLIHEMNNVLTSLTEYSNKQDETIKNIFDILSNSEEGLSILSKLKDTDIDLEKIATSERPTSNVDFSEKVKEAVVYQPPTQFISSSAFISDSGDEEEEEDLLGGGELDESSRKELFDRFLNRS